MAVETNIEKRNNKQVQNNNFVSGIPFQMQKQREEADEFYAALSDRDQRMMEVVITAVHLADSKKQLDSDTENYWPWVQSICANSAFCDTSS